MPRRVGDFRGLTHLSRLRLLYAVQTQPGLTLPDLAARADLHPNTAREHLTILEHEGLVKSRPVSTGTRGRPPVVYEPVEDAQDSPVAATRAERAKERGDLFRRIVDNGAGAGPDGPTADAEAVPPAAGTVAGAGTGAARPSRESRADRAAQADDDGRENGLSAAAHHQIDTLYEHLDDAGFQPALNERDLTVQLVPCQYFRALEKDGRTVCAVHVKLIEQHLKQVPGPVELRRVEPFVTPSSCSIALGLSRRASQAQSADQPRQDSPTDRPTDWPGDQPDDP